MFRALCLDGPLDGQMLENAKDHFNVQTTDACGTYAFARRLQRPHHWIWTPAAPSPYPDAAAALRAAFE